MPMTFKKIKIKNFKRFVEKELMFSPGINIVKGLNEQGKSTIVEAIRTLFFVSPTTSSKVFFTKNLTWQSPNNMVLELDFEHDGSNYVLHKDFLNKRVILSNVDQKRSIEEEEKITSVIREMLGVTSEQIFLSTSLVKQYDMTNIKGGGDLVSSIQKSITGGGREGQNVTEVLKYLENELAEYKRGLDRPAKNVGKIKELQQRIEESERRFAELNSKYQKVRGAGGQKKESESKLEEINSKISLLEQQLDNQKVFDEANRKLEQLNGQIKEIEEEIQQIENLKKDQREVENKIGKIGKFSNLNLNEISTKITSSITLMKSKNEELAELTKKKEKNLLNSKELFSKNQKLLIFLGLSLVITLVIGILSFMIHKPFLVLIPVLINIALLVVYILGRTNTKITGTIGLINQQEKDLKLEVGKIVDEIAGLVKSVGCQTTDEFFTKKAEVGGLLESKDRIDVILKNRLQTKSYDELKKKQVDLLTQKKDIEVNELTDEVKQSKLSPDIYLQKRRELDNLRFERSRLEEQRTESNVRIKDAEVTTDDLVNEEEKLNYYKQTLAEYDHKRAVLELTYDGLKESLGNLSQNIGVSLKEQIEKYLPVITNGRYTQIKIGPDFDVLVFSEEKNDWINISLDWDILSQATMEQIYFLVRLALCKMLSKTARPPLILDDPFVVFDKVRCEQTQKILQEEAKSTQIILLTCHEDYNNWGNLISL